MNKKTYGIIGVIIIVLLLIISCTVNTDKKSSSIDTEDIQTIISNAQNESNNVKEDEKKEFIEISMDDYLNKYNGEESSLILIARPTCHYCQIAEPILHNIAYKYNIDINYLNTDNFQDGDSEKLINSNEFFTNGFGTPLLLVVSNGNINDKQDGLTDTNHYIKFLKTNGFIN